MCFLNVGCFPKCPSDLEVNGYAIKGLHKSKLWLWKLHRASTGSPFAPVVLVGRVFRVLSICQRKRILIPLQGWSKPICNSRLVVYLNFLSRDWCWKQTFQTGPHQEHPLRRQRLETRLGWGMLSKPFCFGVVPLHTKFPPCFRVGWDLWVQAPAKHWKIV